jgi:hypothetical protein
MVHDRNDQDDRVDDKEESYTQHRIRRSLYEDNSLFTWMITKNILAVTRLAI